MRTPDKNQLLASDPTLSAWVGASAGSGKTSVLSDRVLRLMLSGVPPERILCLTYTKTAAAEMSNRIAKSLSVWATQSEADLTAELTALTGEKPSQNQIRQARRLFAALLEAAGGMKIMTIHAFAQSLLKRFPCEAGISPHFEVLDDMQSAEFAAQASREIFADAAYKQDLAVVTAASSPKDFAALIDSLMNSLPQLQQLAQKFPDGDSLRRAYEDACGLAQGETPETVTADFCAKTDLTEEDLRRACAVLSQNAKSSEDRAKGEKMAPFLSASDDDRPLFLNGYIDVFLTKGVIRKRLATKNAAEILPVMEQEAARVLAFTEKKAAARLLENSLALARIGTAIVTRYAQKKKAAALLDFDDLIRTAAALLRAAPDWVMYKLDRGVDHILVDEAQDTSPEQWQIVKSLADEFFAGQDGSAANRTLFVVGDVKQSIYSFQGAAPDEFERMRVFFKQKITQSRHRFETVPMYTSFRSVPPVIEAVNKILKNPDASAGVLKDGEDGTHTAFRKNDTGRVEIWSLEKKAKADTKKQWTKPVERVKTDTPSVRLAKRIAKRIAAMINDKETLSPDNRPIRPKDILILLKRRNGNALAENIIRELKNENVAVAGIDRLKITDHIAVMDLMALGDFLLMPHDDLSLATVLRSPLCNIGEEDLFRLCYGRKGHETVFDRLRDCESGDPDAPLTRASLFLKDLLGMTDTVKPFELYAYVLQKCGKMQAFAERLGEQAFDALNEFLSLALKFEETQLPSLQLFLKYLRQNDVEIKRESQNDADAVRLITVHSAKGLQAPVVFMPDTTSKTYHVPAYFWKNDKNGTPLAFWKAGVKNALTEEFAQGFKQKEDEENNRLLYVAVTRAADRLYVCGCENKKENWYTQIKTALCGANIADYEDKTFVLQNDETASGTAARPQTDEIKRAPLPDWARTPAPQESLPPKPLSPSRLTKDEDEQYDSPLSPQRKESLARGTFVHKLLEMFAGRNFADFESEARAFLNVQAREYDDSFKEDIIAQVSNVLKNPDFQNLFGENSLAEAGVSGVIGADAFAGKIDRLAVLDTQVLIVDYKTSRAVPDDLRKIEKAHLRQMRAYRDLISRIYPDKAVRCFLLYTVQAKLVELPSTLLDSP